MLQSVSTPVQAVARQIQADARLVMVDVYMDLDVRLLTGSTKASERKEIQEGLIRGDIKIMIGTHALLS